jgi:hypothetical protein
VSGGDDYQKLFAQLSDLRRQLANTHQVGTVHEVKGTKLRMLLGKNADGKEVLSPWLNTNSMRGGAREQRFFKKGQNLSLFCPNGDVAQGIIQPYAPNKNFKTPEHADGSGQDEESYQLADYREKQTKEGYDNWLQPDEEEKEGGQQGGQQGGGGGGGQKQQKKGHVGGDKAVMKSRMNKDGGITHRVGKDVRVAAHKDGAKLRAGSDWVVVKKGKIIFSQPPILGKDPIKNDDK